MFDPAFNGFDLLLFITAVVIVTANHLYETNTKGGH